MLFAIIAQAAFPFTNTCVCQAEAVVVIVLVQSALGMTKTGEARTGGVDKKVSSSKQGNKEILVITNACSPAAGFHPAPLKAEADFCSINPCTTLPVLLQDPNKHCSTISSKALLTMKKTFRYED